MKIVLVGYGAMGKLVHDLGKDKIAYIYGNEAENSLKNLNEIQEQVDVILDFSNPVNLEMIYDFAKKTSTPVIFATTGYTEAQENKIKELSSFIPVLRSANFSLGILIMNQLIKQITPILADSFDIEIIEAHHNRKVDAPSGTAKLLLNSVLESTQYKPVYGREGIHKREANEVGVHVIRGGTIVGEHEVLYCGEDEVLTIKHSAQSKKAFAKGALVACEYMRGRKAKLYTMEDVLFGKGE